MDLEILKLDANLCRKLDKHGFKTALSVALLHVEDLREVLGVSKDEAHRLQVFILEKFAPKMHSGHIFINRLSTGCPQIDNILRGGLSSGRILEVYGYSGAGKTQFCLQLLIQVQLPPSVGGFSKSAVYITTEQPFPSKRFHELCSMRKTPFLDNPEDNVFVIRCRTKESLIECITHRLPKLMQERQIGVVIIDSIAGAYRSEHQDTDYKERSLEFSRITTNLRKLLILHKAVGLFVNQVTDNIETNETEACLGLAWYNLVGQRFEIARESATNTTRTFKVIKSPECEQISAEFTIQTTGLQ